MTCRPRLHSVVTVSLLALAAVVSCGKATLGTNTKLPDGGGSGGAAAGSGGAAAGSGGNSGDASGSGGTGGGNGSGGSGGGVDARADGKVGFACGSSLCDPATQYCEHNVGGNGVPPQNICVPGRSNCGSRVTCACAYTSCATGCVEPDGNVTLTTGCGRPPFACGDKICTELEYCRETIPGPPPAPGDPTNRYSCWPIPARCALKEVRCDCLVPYAAGGSAANPNICNEANPSGPNPNGPGSELFTKCTDDMRGHVTVQCTGQ